MADEVTIHDITIVTPRTIRIEFRDGDIVSPGITAADPGETGDYNIWLLRTHPTLGSRYAQVIGPGIEAYDPGNLKTHYRWSATISDEVLDRDAVDDPDNWPDISGINVVSVNRKTEAFKVDQGGEGGGQNRIAQMRHKVYVTLASDLPEGVHTIGLPPALVLADRTFTYSDTSTRCPSIKVNQVGQRPGDIYKKAIFAQRIPGYGSEHGAINYASFSMGDGSIFNVLDANNVVVFSGTVELRLGPSDPEPKASFWNGTPQDFSAVNQELLWLSSTTTTVYEVTAITLANPAVVTAPGHTYANGDNINLYDLDVDFNEAITGRRAFATPTSSSGFYKVHAVSGDTFQLKRLDDGVLLDTTIHAYNFQTSSNRGKVRKLWQCNRAGTYVYECDFSAFTPSSSFMRYRIQIPGLGVSYEFRLKDSAWYHAFIISLKGLYNQRNGCALSASVGGYERPVSFRHGVNLCTVKASTLPGFSSSENGFPHTHGSAAINSFLGSAPPWVTATEVDWWGGHQDAGDWDSILNSHMNGMWMLLDIYQRQPALRSVDIGIPLSSVAIGSTYDAIDGEGSLLHECIWGIDTWRRNQLPSGAVYGGLQFGPDDVQPQYTNGSGGGGDRFQTSYLWRFGQHVTAPDHVSTMQYAATAAKLSKVFRILGYTTLANLWRDSADDAFTWAYNLYTDATDRDAYYLTDLDLKTKAGWTTEQYDGNILAMADALVDGRLAFAASSLMSAWEGSSTEVAYYRNIVDTTFSFGGDVTDHFGPAMWEYVNSPDATPSVKTSYEALITGNALGYMVDFFEGPNTYDWAVRGAAGFHADQGMAMALIWGHQLLPAGTDKSRVMRAMQGQMNHNLGVNAHERSIMSGIGQDHFHTRLHTDTMESDQGNNPPGSPMYLYDKFGLTTASYFDIYGASGQIVVEPCPSDPEQVRKSLTPEFTWDPLFESYLGSPFAISRSEYTIGGQTMPWTMLFGYLHAYDGNTDMSAISNSLSFTVKWSS